MNDEHKARRRRGVWLGLLAVLLLALGSAGYALSSSPSVPAGSGKPSASPSSQVLAPSGSSTTSAAKPSAPSTTTTSAPVVLAPAASSNGNGNGNGNGNCVEPSNGNGNCEKTFGVTVGQVPTLYPSLVRNVPVTYSNPNSFDIVVTTYRVSVAVPSSKAAVCPASSLQVPAGTVTMSPGLVAPKKGSVSTTFPVKLGASVPDGCQGVTFTITVNASAVKK